MVFFGKQEEIMNEKRIVFIGNIFCMFFITLHIFNSNSIGKDIDYKQHIYLINKSDYHRGSLHKQTAAQQASYSNFKFGVNVNLPTGWSISQIDSNGNSFSICITNPLYKSIFNIRGLICQNLTEAFLWCSESYGVIIKSFVNDEYSYPQIGLYSDSIYVDGNRQITGYVYWGANYNSAASGFFLSKKHCTFSLYVLGPLSESQTYLKTEFVKIFDSVKFSEPTVNSSGHVNPILAKKNVFFENKILNIDLLGRIIVLNPAESSRINLIKHNTTNFNLNIR